MPAASVMAPGEAMGTAEGGGAAGAGGSGPLHPMNAGTTMNTNPSLLRRMRTSTAPVVATWMPDRPGSEAQGGGDDAGAAGGESRSRVRRHEVGLVQKVPADEVDLDAPAHMHADAGV